MNRDAKLNKILAIKTQECLKIILYYNQVGLKDSGRIGQRYPGINQLYAEYIMRNAGLEEAQAAVKIAGRKYQ